jgi:hypothetical protein
MRFPNCQNRIYHFLGFLVQEKQLWNTILKVFFTAIVLNQVFCLDQLEYSTLEDQKNRLSKSKVCRLIDF